MFDTKLILAAIGGIIIGIVANMLTPLVGRPFNWFMRWSGKNRLEWLKGEVDFIQKALQHPTELFCLALSMIGGSLAGLLIALALYMIAASTAPTSPAHSWLLSVATGVLFAFAGFLSALSHQLFIVAFSAKAACKN